MFKYMVNPSNAPKKGKRKNPELLIVNPYSLNEDREEQKLRAKMAKRNRRRNPGFFRRNPSLAEIQAEFLGPDLKNLKTVGIMTVFGGFALAVGSAVAGAQFGASASSTFGKAAVAMLSGILGGIAVHFAGDKLSMPALKDAAVPGAMGAMVLGLWSLVQAPVENAAAALTGTIISAPAPVTPAVSGYGSWTKEFNGLGQSYYDEFTKGVSPGMNGLGQPVIASTVGADNPFLHGYEPMGDIYNSQRLGSFEAEPGFGAFTPENANPRDQQVADSMKASSGAYGNYGAYEGMPNDPFTPFISN